MGACYFPGFPRFEAEVPLGNSVPVYCMTFLSGDSDTFVFASVIDPPFAECNASAFRDVVSKGVETTTVPTTVQAML
jgi:hypothetical protein